MTFNVRGRAGVMRDQAAGLVALGLAIAVTTTAIALLDLVAPSAERAVELAVLVAANGLATILRFVLLRSWIAPPGRRVHQPGASR